MTRSTCDVLVIGGGPAGIAAASRAAELGGGARTLLVDEGLALGGQIWRASHAGRQGTSARRWIDRLGRSGAAIRSSTSVVDIEPVGDRFRVVADAQGDVISIDARAVVLATGARELFLPFPGWTLPNVVGVGGG
jgi:flavin-dependent dehydrogenase